MKNIIFIASIILLSCKESKNIIPNNPQVYIDTCGKLNGKVNIRIKNVSNYTYEKFSYDQKGGFKNNPKYEKIYGNLPASETSCYRAYDSSYSIGTIRATINSEEIVMSPIDYVGEILLSNGDYTLTVDIPDISRRMYVTTLTKE